MTKKHLLGRLCRFIRAHQGGVGTRVRDSGWGHRSGDCGRSRDVLQQYHDCAEHHRHRYSGYHRCRDASKQLANTADAS